VTIVSEAKGKQRGPGKNYNVQKAWGTHDPYELQPDFSLKLGADVIVEPDGRLYYEYLLSKGWRVSIATLNGMPVTVVAASAWIYGRTVTISGDPIKGGFKVMTDLGGNAGQGVSYVNVERAAKKLDTRGLPSDNAIIEVTAYNPNRFVRRITYLSVTPSMFPKWIRMKTESYAPDGILMSGEDYTNWQSRTSSLPGFHRSKIKGQAAIAYYQARPWAINLFRTNLEVYVYSSYRGIKDVLYTELHHAGHDPAIDWLAQQVGSLAGAKKVSTMFR
jgi:hypothetical protein